MQCHLCRKALRWQIRETELEISRLGERVNSAIADLEVALRLGVQRAPLVDRAMRILISSVQELRGRGEGQPPGQEGDEARP